MERVSTPKAHGTGQPPEAENSPRPHEISRPAEAHRLGRPPGGWRLKLYTVIFEADTPAGRAFDLALAAVILASVTVVVLDSVEPLHQRWSFLFDALEWAFTLLFTLEYAAR